MIDILRGGLFRCRVPHLDLTKAIPEIWPINTTSPTGELLTIIRMGGRPDPV